MPGPPFPLEALVSFDVVRVPVWNDNYAWVLAAADGTAALVDSPEAGPIEAELERRGLRLTHIFNTHHHPDHVGANDDLCSKWPELEVWGGHHDLRHKRIPGQTRALGDDERFEWGGVTGTVREIPGHTLGHIGYFFDNACAFVGDTLFFGGCGRLFEGTAEQMDRALNDVIAALPGETLLYCAHEYTAANLRFARTVDPDNTALRALVGDVDARRSRGEATVPSTLDVERAINPFLRCDLPALRAAAGLDDSVPRHEVLGRIRSMKDGFRG
jgi:hydroxyacylglutathione hydrolase